MTTATAVEEVAVEEAVVEEKLEDLTGHDRCDKCGAQAYVRVMLVTDHDLLFCAHDYAEAESKLQEITYKIRDERARLTV